AATGNYSLPTITAGEACIDDNWVTTNTANAPDGRSQHTAVWTGSAMVIGGGAHLNAGGKSPPATDSWAAVSTNNAPTGRSLHTAVWTGSQMIVWGGDNNGTALNTGGRYCATAPSPTPTPTASPSPTATVTATATPTASPTPTPPCIDDTWTATSIVNAPDGRDGHTALWTGSEMIVWGGQTKSGFVNTGGKNNPATDSWTPTSTINAPAARWLHTAVWTGSEMIVWG